MKIIKQIIKDFKKDMEDDTPVYDRESFYRQQAKMATSTWVIMELACVLFVVGIVFLLSTFN